MKIRINKNVKVELSTLVSIEWKKWHPQLYVHERFENKIKWLLRGLTILGIVLSVVSIEEWYFSLGLALLMLGAEQFIERSVFMYTTMIIQPFPNFDIDHSEWLTNGFLIPIDKDSEEPYYMGPAFRTREYAEKFFGYIRSWVNGHSFNDIEDNIVVSFIIEPNSTYTTYLYADPDRTRLEGTFAKRKKKRGRREQQFVHQMIYWNNLDFKDGYKIKLFLERNLPEQKPFYFTPFVAEPFEPLFDSCIKKYKFKVHHRAGLTQQMLEYHYVP